MLSMQKILLISSNPRHRELLETAIDEEKCSIAKVLEEPSDLLLWLQGQSIDLVILDLKDSGEMALEPVRHVMQSEPLPIVMFVEQGDRSSAANATAAGVSAYVVDGLQLERVAPILAAAVTRFEATKSLIQELARTKTTLQERKIIERAKGLLMEQGQMSEDEAFRAMRKLAMDRNRRLADIAASIVETASLMK